MMTKKIFKCVFPMTVLFLSVDHSTIGPCIPELILRKTPYVTNVPSLWPYFIELTLSRKKITSQ